MILLVNLTQCYCELSLTIKNVSRGFSLQKVMSEPVTTSENYIESGDVCDVPDRVNCVYIYYNLHRCSKHKTCTQESFNYISLVILSSAISK